MLVVASFLARLKDGFLGSVTDFVSRLAYPCFLKRVGLFLQWCWKKPAILLATADFFEIEAATRRSYQKVFRILFQLRHLQIR